MECLSSYSYEKMIKNRHISHIHNEDLEKEINNCSWPHGKGLLASFLSKKSPLFLSAERRASRFRNLQIPCQSCGVMQSTLKCNQPLGGSSAGNISVPIRESTLNPDLQIHLRNVWDLKNVLFTFVYCWITLQLHLQKMRWWTLGKSFIRQTKTRFQFRWWLVWFHFAFCVLFFRVWFDWSSLIIVPLFFL